MKLEIGFNDHFEIRNEQISANIAGGINVLYLSDLHFNRHSVALTSRMISSISELDPDIILLGGDYVDFKKDLVHLKVFLQAICQRKNVFAIAGNHDYSFGVGIIKNIMEEHHIGWIENDSITFAVNSTTVQIDGSRPSETGSADFNILCLHKPAEMTTFNDQYNLVFAGHLHGCQFVFWQNDKGLYPGRLFFKWNVLEKKSGDCNYYISKGLGHTLPVRYNCAKEMIFVQVAGKQI